MRHSILQRSLLVSILSTLATAVAYSDPMAVSPAPSPTPHHLENIAARARVGTNGNVLIAGIIITGSSPKSVLIRASGPSLEVNGNPIPGRLPDPTLTLYISGSDIPLAGNNDWQETQQREIIGTGLAPSNSLDSAILMTLDPGQYTAIVRDSNDRAGVGLLEVFDLSTDPMSKLGNISTRGVAGTGDDVLIAGLIVGGGGGPEATIRVLVRGIGPSLATHGVAGALADPTLELFDANGNSLASNDNWRTSADQSDIEQSGLAPTNDSESAILTVLLAGNYTAIVRGQNQTTGAALIEVYDVPSNGPF